MSNYLDRLKQLDDEKFSRHTPDMELTKPPKAPYVSFVSTGTGHIETKITDSKTPKPETLQDRQREARRQKALALLDEQPETMRGIYPDTNSDRDNVILAVAIRGVGTCELAIPRAKYDPWLLLGMIERMSQTVH